MNAVAKDLLSTDNIVKSFETKKVLQGISISFARGKTYGIAGPNGSGKSTLVKILSGLIKPDAGRINVNSKPAIKISPQSQMSQGVVAIQQTQELLQELSVIDNCFIGTSYARAPCDPVAFDKTIGASPFWDTWRPLLQSAASSIKPATRVGNLSSEDRFCLLLFRSLLWRPEVIILDESLELIPSDRKDHFASLFKSFAAAGKAVAYVSHNIEFLVDNCDKLIGVRDGRIVADIVINEKDTMLQKTFFREKVFGRPRPVISRALIKTNTSGGKAWAVDDASIQGISTPLTFEIPKPGVMIIKADLGRGSEVFVRCLARGVSFKSGRLTLESRVIDLTDDSYARELFVAWLPPEPKEYSFPRLTLFENIALKSVINAVLSPVLIEKKFRKSIADLINSFDIHPQDLSMPLKLFSGGNQQKAVLARELNCSHDLVLALSPTKGLDEPSREKVIDKLLNAAIDGTPLLIVSSDEEEFRSFHEVLRAVLKAIE